MERELVSERRTLTGEAGQGQGGQLRLGISPVAKPAAHPYQLVVVAQS